MKPNDTVSDFFLLTKKEVLRTKNNKKYLNIGLSDKSGQIDAKLWDIGDNNYDFLIEGEPVFVEGRVEKFKEKLQVVISKIKQLENFSNEIFNELILITPKNIEQLFSELIVIKDTIYNTHLKKLIDKILIKDEELSIGFKTAPAAKQFHHAYRGGLLEHTLSVVKLSDMLAKNYTLANRDILLTGAILHDIGKIFEYDHKTFNRTDNGKLLGHIIIGVSIVEKKASSIKNFPENLLNMIKHLILSHHGELEWGSPVQPATIEAFLLHYADNIDSKVQIFYEIGQKENNWQYSKSLRRNILLTDNEEENEKHIKTLFD